MANIQNPLELNPTVGGKQYAAGISKTKMQSLVDEVNKVGDKYEKPAGGIPSSDLSSAVQGSLAKADESVSEGNLEDVIDGLHEEYGDPNRLNQLEDWGNIADEATLRSRLRNVSNLSQAHTQRISFTVGGKTGFAIVTYNGEEFYVEYTLGSNRYACKQDSNQSGGWTPWLGSTELETYKHLDELDARCDEQEADILLLVDEVNKVGDKYEKPAGGIPSSDLSSAVQESLRRADESVSIFDVSIKYPTSGVEGGNTYTLEGALLVLNTNLPSSKKKGGMSIKFIQSSDNKYIQARCMAQNFTTDVTQWQGVDDKPAIFSENLVKSGGVAEINLYLGKQSNITSDVILYKGYIEKNGTITAYDTWYYGVVLLKARHTITVDNTNIGAYPSLGIAQSENVEIGDVVTVLSGKTYIAENDTWIVISAGTHLNSVLIGSSDTIFDNADNAPTAGSDNLVKSGGVADAIGKNQTPIVEKKIGGYFVDTTGHRADYGKFGIFGGIPVKRGDICTAVVSNNVNSGVSPLAFSTVNSYYSNMYCEQVVAYVSGQTIYKATAEFDGFVFITSGNDSTPSLSIFSFFDFSKMEEDIDDAKNDIEEIKEELIINNQITVSLGKLYYYVGADGKRYNWAALAIYGALPVKAGDKFTINNIQGLNSAACPVAWSTSASMNSDMDCTPLAVYQQDVTSYSVIVPNDGYLFISASKDVTPEAWKVESLPEMFVKKLLDKKIAWFGDSITEGFGRVPYDEKYGWATPIERDFGAVCDNQGISGATLRDQTSIGRHCIPLDLVNYINNGGDADYFILSGGFNDRDGSANWGTVDKNTYSEYSELGYTTTVEAMEKMIAYCMQYLSTKKFGFIICYDINDVPENPGWEPSHWNTLADRLIEACDKWGMPYLDLRKTCGFNLCTEGLRTIYGTDLTTGIPAYDEDAGYVADQRVVYNNVVYKSRQQIAAPAGEFDSSKWSQISDDNGHDRGHCNRFAYDKMSNLVGEWILSL